MRSLFPFGFVPLHTSNACTLFYSIMPLFAYLFPLPLASLSSFTGGRGFVRLPSRPRLPSTPARRAARAAVRRGREDVGARHVPAVLGRGALPTADAHTLVPGRAVATGEFVRRVLPAEASGERSEERKGTRRARGVDRTPGLRAERGAGAPIEQRSRNLRVDGGGGVLAVNPNNCFICTQTQGGSTERASVHTKSGSGVASAGRPYRTKTQDLCLPREWCPGLARRYGPGRAHVSTM